MILTNWPIALYLSKYTGGFPRVNHNRFWLANKIQSVALSILAPNGNIFWNRQGCFPWRNIRSFLNLDNYGINWENVWKIWSDDTNWAKNYSWNWPEFFWKCSEWAEASWLDVYEAFGWLLLNDVIYPIHCSTLWYIRGLSEKIRPQFHRWVFVFPDWLRSQLLHWLIRPHLMKIRWTRLNSAQTNRKVHQRPWNTKINAWLPVLIQINIVKHSSGHWG